MKESAKIALMLVLLAVLVTGALSDALRPASIPVAAAARNAEKPVVVVDAGHGGMDGGAVGVSGTPEKDINLAVAQKTELLLTLLGVRTAMTREGDADIAPPGDYDSIRARKTADMHARRALVDAYPHALLLSIHMNRYSQSRYSGAQVFYAATEGSQALAELLQANLVACLDPANTRQAAAVDPALYLYRSVSCPAVLVECGFLSNPREEALLRTEEYQRRLALTLAASVAGFLS